MPGFVAAVKNSLTEFLNDPFTNCLTVKEIFQVLSIRNLSGTDENQMALLVKLKLSTCLTHDDVKVLERYLFCRQESVQ